MTDVRQTKLEVFSYGNTSFFYNIYSIITVSVPQGLPLRKVVHSLSTRYQQISHKKHHKGKPCGVFFNVVFTIRNPPRFFEIAGV